MLPTTSSTASTSRGRSPFVALALTEGKLFLREPVAVIWGLVFPVVLLVVIGSLTASDRPARDLGGLRVIDAYVPILMVFVLAILALSALSTVLAGYRERGYLRRLATTPVGPSRLLAAQLALTATVAAGAIVLIAAVGRLAYQVRLPHQLAGFVLVIALGAAATLALGALLAAVSPGGRSANAIGALALFPMMFFAGLWLPRAQMSPALRHISDFTPLGATVGAVQDTIRGSWPHPAHLAVLAVYTLVLVPVAVKLFRWDQ